MKALNKKVNIQRKVNLLKRNKINNEDTNFSDSLIQVGLFLLLIPSISVIKNYLINGKMFDWTDCLNTSVTVFIVMAMAIWKDKNLYRNVRTNLLTKRSGYSFVKILILILTPSFVFGYCISGI